MESMRRTCSRTELLQYKFYLKQKKLYFLCSKSPKIKFPEDEEFYLCSILTEKPLIDIENKPIVFNGSKNIKTSCYEGNHLNSKSHRLEQREKNNSGEKNTIRDS